MQLTFPQSSDLFGQSGFLGSSYLGQEYSNDGTKVTSLSCSCECSSLFQCMQGNIAMTYSAVSALKALGDDLRRVDRVATVAGLSPSLCLSISHQTSRD
jgi:hypothetical protein